LPHSSSAAALQTTECDSLHRLHAADASHRHIRSFHATNYERIRRTYSVFVESCCSGRYFQDGVKFLHAPQAGDPRILLRSHAGDSGTRLASCFGIMGVTRPFISPRPLEAEVPFALPQLYVMPAPQDRREASRAHLPGELGRLIAMPPRWPSAPVRPRNQYRGNTVDWPRGYPAHDDL
jgi:hypothetical protein